MLTQVKSESASSCFRLFFFLDFGEKTLPAFSFSANISMSRVGGGTFLYLDSNCVA